MTISLDSTAPYASPPFLQRAHLAPRLVMPQNLASAASIRHTPRSPFRTLFAADMPNSYGLRARTRKTFARGFGEKGLIRLSTYMHTYHVGDYVDIKANSACQKGISTSAYPSSPAEGTFGTNGERFCVPKA